MRAASDCQTVMTDDATFTEPDDTHDDWVDVRMTDPDAGEWDIDAVVVDGRVEYVDLRIKPKHLSAFVECLVEDVGDDRAREILADAADLDDVESGGDGRE